MATLSVSPEGVAMMKVSYRGLPPDGSAVLVTRTEEVPIPITSPSQIAFTSLRCQRAACPYCTGPPFAVVSLRLLRALEEAPPDPTGRRAWRWTPSEDDCVTPLVDQRLQSAEDLATARARVVAEIRRHESPSS
ncbi:MAG: hypothetical protein JWO77_1781 [Ilumatobacteraceae bacterium]|nr:hypothetical protein [Ilumatobacteraceae bacterium]